MGKALPLPQGEGEAFPSLPAILHYNIEAFCVAPEKAMALTCSGGRMRHGLQSPPPRRGRIRPVATPKRYGQYHEGLGMIVRRTVLVAGATLLARRAVAGLPVPRGDSLGFRIMRHGSEIGTHMIGFERNGNALKVQTAIDVRVTLLSIPVARFKHRSSELWRDTTLVEAAGETSNNGEHNWMSARRTGEGLVVAGSQTKPYVAPESATPVSYWNKRMLSGPMISLENGVLSSPKVADLRTDSVQLASGRKIPATHYNLSAPVDADLWYDETDTWAAMLLTAVDGSEVRYERL